MFHPTHCYLSLTIVVFKSWNLPAYQLPVDCLKTEQLFYANDPMSAFLHFYNLETDLPEKNKIRARRAAAD